MNHILIVRMYFRAPFSSNKTCAICRKKSRLCAAIKIFPQYDDEPSEEESKLLSRVQVLEEKLIFLQSEVDALKSENRRMKCSVENSKNQSVDYREFMEDLSNDLAKTVTRIDHFRMNMKAYDDRDRDRGCVGKGFVHPVNLRKRITTRSSVEGIDSVGLGKKRKK